MQTITVDNMIFTEDQLREIISGSEYMVDIIREQQTALQIIAARNALRPHELAENVLQRVKDRSERFLGIQPPLEGARA
ncbi:MAG: hypothetical protein KGI37_07570 [Alphaproteobacteria bacterium]|nr:hypothetical protein [Alphaproteobacteria bacterium]